MVKTQLEPGTLLSKADSQQHVDVALHSRYHDIMGHLSFLVSCTRPDLAFAYAELSKFVAYPGVMHMHAAEHTLQYLMGTYDQGITYCQLDPPSLGGTCWRGGWTWTTQRIQTPVVP
eukprot:1197423-Rhodomonas_salina.2